ncbi:MAG: hypothetical protein OEZ13_01440 [Spirochaetia bacterium]|nr:hypothetical protein [Spirochaetia bacterium]
MYIGHYAVSFAIKKFDKKTSLGQFFIATQLVDIIFFHFALMGIERFSLIENYTQSTHFNLEYMPYTHSLAASFFWSLLIYLFSTLIMKKNKVTAFFFSITVFIHWFFDLIVHTPDLPLLSDSSIKAGFGLWENAIATFLLEAVLIGTGFIIYLRDNKSGSLIYKYAMIFFVFLLIVINSINIFAPPVFENKFTFAFVSIFLYIVFAVISHYLDKKISE